MNFFYILAIQSTSTLPDGKRESAYSMRVQLCSIVIHVFICTNLLCSLMTLWYFALHGLSNQLFKISSITILLNDSTYLVNLMCYLQKRLTYKPTIIKF